MTNKEFQDRTGDELTADVEALYMALPNMDKAAFCWLYVLNKGLTAAGLADIFSKLRTALAVYGALQETAAACGLADAVKDFPQTEQAREIETRLMQVAAAKDAAAAIK